MLYPMNNLVWFYSVLLSYIINSLSSGLDEAFPSRDSIINWPGSTKTLIGEALKVQWVRAKIGVSLRSQ